MLRLIPATVSLAGLGTSQPDSAQISLSYKVREGLLDPYLEHLYRTGPRSLAAL